LYLENSSGSDRSKLPCSAKQQPQKIHKSFPQRWHCFNLHAHFAHNEYMPLLVPSLQFLQVPMLSITDSFWCFEQMN
jgi:hypothetical protein